MGNDSPRRDNSFRQDWFHASPKAAPILSARSAVRTMPEYAESCRLAPESQGKRVLAAPRAIVARREMMRQGGGDLDESSTSLWREVARTVDHAAGPQVPIEGHFDH